MGQEPNLEERLSQDNKPNQNSDLVSKFKHHAPLFLADGSSYVLFYSFFMTVAERLSGMNWEEIKRTRGVGAVTGFLSGHVVNLLRGRFGKNTDETMNSAVKRKKIAADLAIGFVSTMPFYYPLLYFGGRDPDQGIIFPLIVGSAFSAAAGLGYGYCSDKYRKMLRLPPVLYK